MNSGHIEGFRLSPQQRRAWFLLRKGEGFGNRLLLDGSAVSPARLREAVDTLAARHEVLRTIYSWLPGMPVPVQVPLPRLLPSWREVALDDGPGASAGLDELVAEEGREPFDLQNGPLVRATLVSAGAEGSSRWLLLSLPALAADARSLENVAADLAALCAGGDLAEPVSYVQFSEFQNALLEGEEGSELRQAWSRRSLESLPRPSLLFRKAGGDLGEGVRYRPAFQVDEVAPEVSEALGRRAVELGLPLPALLAAAWQVLLGRLTGQPELALAYLSEGRSHDIFQSAVGLFARWIPLEARLHRGTSFADLAAQWAESVREGEEAAEGFLWGVEGDEPKGDLCPDLGFAFVDLRQDSAATLPVVSSEARWEHCELMLRGVRRDSRLATELVFDADLFDAGDVWRVAGALHRLLAAAAADPRQPAGELPWLGEAEREHLLTACNRTAYASSWGRAFHHRFEEQAARTPAAAALAYEEESLTYQQLNQRANQLARHLRSLGVGPESPVLLYLDRSADLVVALLAVMKAGGVYAPLATGQPRKRLAHVLEDLGGPVVVTRSSRSGELPAGSRHVLCLDSEAAAVASHDDGNLEVEVDLGSLAYVIFTSGSTGLPKGVMVEHRQLLSYVGSIVERLDLPAGASYATVSTFAADLGNTMVFPALCLGGCLHVVAEETATDPAALARYFSSHAIDCLKIVPSHFQALRQEMADLASLMPRRRLVFGGEALSPSLAREASAAVADCRVFNHYGPSETTVGVTTFDLAAEELDARCLTVPLGRPLGNVEAYVLDDLLAPVPAWVAGELYLGGSNVTRGYLNRPGLTAERYLPHPFSGRPGGRLYRTGDNVVRLPGGEIVFLGRVDNQVKFHGFRIELDELRGALNRHPKVRDSVVAIRQDRQGRDILVAYYVSRQEVEVAELRALLLEVILEETVPNLFVHLKKLPLTLNGKVNHAALPGVEEAQQTRRAYVVPRTPAEELMAQIWSDVLGIERIGVDDNFFDLGGHSLLATQLVARVRQTFSLEVPLRVLFDTVSLADFTAQVAAQLAVAPRPTALRRVPRDRELPLSFAQERLWFMDQLEPGNSAYNIHAAFRLAGPLDAELLERGLRRSVARHESLRTLFGTVQGRAVQVIQDPGEHGGIAVVHRDLGDLPAAEREAAAERLAAEESRRPFDLACGPLLRALILRLGEHDHLLALTLHHIISDGWSLGILFREVADYYESSLTGVVRNLRELPIQYADYAVWQREWLQGENLDRQLAYWVKRLQNMPDLVLPADRPRPELPSFAGGNHLFQLSEDLTRSLRDLSRKHRTTLFMTLLAAFDLLLSRYTGLEDVVVGTDVAMRDRLETEGLIGFFVNNLVLRTDLSGNPTFVELLERVRQTTLGAYANQDMPFERLVKALRPKREAGQTPLFQVLFAQQGARPSQLALPSVEAAPVAGDKVTAKFDVALFFRDAGPQIVGRWNYRKDLFESATVARMARHFETLLAGLCAEPEARLGSFEMLTAEERREQTVIKEERRSKKMGTLRNARRQTLDLADIDLVRTGFLEGAPDFPLVVQPALEAVDLAEWVGENRDRVEGWLLQHGALLFRGFAIDSVAEFERFACAATTGLFADYGDLPREEGGERVYHSTPYPQEKMILFHNESSHLSRWPTRQMFYCVTAAESGGETPIVDCRRMYRELGAAVIDPLREKKLMYVRNFTDGLDVSWQHFFRTEDREVVERRCREWSMELEWKPDGLCTRQVCDAVVRHPKTGEEVFFNQIQLFHGACMEPEVRQAMLEVFDGKDLPRDLRDGDGAPIADEVVRQISDTYSRLAVAFPWQEKDILLLDNMLVAHARNPFVGPRKIVVAMGDMMSREQLQP